MALGPRSIGEWLSGLILSLPVGAVLWWVRAEPDAVQVVVATIAIILAVPWVVPALILVGAASSPVYMWLHTQGPVMPVLSWLGGVVLVAAVVGCHINGALLFAWWSHRRRATPEPGLREFLQRHADRS